MVLTEKYESLFQGERAIKLLNPTWKLSIFFKKKIYIYKRLKNTFFNES